MFKPIAEVQKEDVEQVDLGVECRVSSSPVRCT